MAICRHGLFVEIADDAEVHPALDAAVIHDESVARMGIGVEDACLHQLARERAQADVGDLLGVDALCSDVVDPVHPDPVDMLHHQHRLRRCAAVDVGDVDLLDLLEALGEAFDVARLDEHVEFSE